MSNGKRIVLILLGYLVACVCGVQTVDVLTVSAFRLRRPLIFHKEIIYFVLISSIFPSIVVAIACEILRIRSFYIYPILGILVASFSLISFFVLLFIAGRSGIGVPRPPERMLSFDEMQMFVKLIAEFSILIGIPAGCAYWLIAGRTAGWGPAKTSGSPH
jgi:hypothetical protein